MRARAIQFLFRLATAALAALVLPATGCDPPPEEIERRPCSLGTDDPQINSCYYCCFAEPGLPGAYTGCFSGPLVTEEHCRQHLIDDKNCTDPHEIEIQLDCECEIDCDEPDWF
jgi:hypothetical protein